MKKSTALMVFVAAAGLASCGGPTTPTANLKSDIDSLSYSLGVANSKGLMDYASARLGVDSANTTTFIEGIIEGTSNTSAKEKANVAGIQIGQQVNNDMFEGINQQLFSHDSINSLNKEKFINGFIQGAKGSSSVTTNDAFRYVQSKVAMIQNDTLKTKIPNNVIDSLSYMMGVSNSQGLITYATTRMGIDSTYISNFTDAIEKGTSIKDTKQKAQLAGVQIGMQLSGDMFNSINKEIFGDDASLSLNKGNFLAGFIESAQNKNIINMQDANELINVKSVQIKRKATEIKYAKYKKENEQFLLDNKTKEGIKTTNSGLQYRIIKEGKGEIPTKESRIKVHYKGTLIDGTQFDSSYDRKRPATFICNQVIQGWTEALTMMPVGSKWELYIPQELGYGFSDMGTIKPYSTLIFEVELLGIEK